MNLKSNKKVVMKNNVRWEVRYTSNTTGKEIIHCRETRKNARSFMRLLKRHPDAATNVKMYRVNEFLDDKGDPMMTFHKRAR